MDYSRRRLADKRGGALRQVTLDERYLASGHDPVDILALDQALERFQKVDARGSQILELHFFGGLTFEEIALVLDLTSRTVKRDWSMARAWLHDELSKAS